ncbi:MAG: DUF6057 family protein [Bacteroidaceae bacterium]
MSKISVLEQRVSRNYLDKSRVIKYVNNVIFALFTYSYLVGMQSDYIYLLLNKVFSINPYSSYLTAFVSTILLLFLRHRLNFYSRLHGTFNVISYVPLAVLLILLKPSLFSVLWALVLCVIYIFIVRKNRYHRSSSIDIRKMMRRNILTMIFILFSIALCGTTSDVERYSLSIERYIVEGNYKKATEVGKNALSVNSQLTALRAYALDHNHLLGEHLFEYPLVGTSAELIVDANACDLITITKHISTLQQYPTKIQQLIKGRQQPLLSRKQKSFEKRSTEFVDLYPFLFVGKTKEKAYRWRDYRLCALLLDKKLDRFAKELKILYSNVPVLDSLPKHYREALFLYNHIRLHPVIAYHNIVMQTDFADFTDMQRKATTQLSKNNTTRRIYGATYWWYYYYR